MRLNAFHLWGYVLSMFGAGLHILYSGPNPPMHEDGYGFWWPYPDIPDWLPGGLMLGGIGLFFGGTVRALIGRRTSAEDDSKDEKAQDK